MDASYPRIYVVDEVLKSSAFETTEIVHLVDDPLETPYIRKTIDRKAGIGAVYSALATAQKNGVSFRRLPRIYDYEVLDDHFMVVMNYVPGTTLQDYIERQGPSLALAQQLFPLICEAVNELHSLIPQPLIHRDLKPSNIMVVPIAYDALDVAIIDFGIARIFSPESTQDTTHFGTRYFAPPEQFGFGQTDVRSDVYALGVVLYYCLTGEPFELSFRDQLLAQLPLAPAVKAVIMKATAFDPRNRYQDVLQLRDAFMEALANPSAIPQSSLVINVTTTPTVDNGVGVQEQKQNSQYLEMKSDKQFGNGFQNGESSRLKWFKEWRNSTARHVVGLTWNSIVTFCWFMLCLVSTVLIWFPEASANSSIDAMSQVQRLWIYGFFSIPFFTLIAAFLWDKSSLRKRVQSTYGDGDSSADTITAKILRFYFCCPLSLSIFRVSITLLIGLAITIIILMSGSIYFRS